MVDLETGSREAKVVAFVELKVLCRTSLIVAEYERSLVGNAEGVVSFWKSFH